MHRVLLPDGAATVSAMDSTTTSVPRSVPRRVPRTRRTAARRVAPVLGALSLTLLLTACSQDAADDTSVVSLESAGTGGSAAGPTSDGASAESGPPDDAEAELLAYVECLRGEGLDVPDPGVDAEGDLTLGGPGAGDGGPGAGTFDPEAFEAATEVCGDVPEGAVAGLAEVDGAEFEDAALAFAECMREEGVDVPDPDLSGGVGPGAGGEGGPFGDLDLEDPEVSAALETCQQVFSDAGTGSP